MAALSHTTSPLLLAIALLTGCQTSTTGAIATDNGAHLYNGVDRYHMPITTTSPDAQRWFDQGLQFAYGFNHDEAIRSFEVAATLDPESPMPRWGIAYCNGIHVNNREMTEPMWKAGWQAAQQAKRRMDNATPKERALIRAVLARYTWPAPAEQQPYDEAYADAMERAWMEFPNDPDVSALYAESLMDLQPWDYWTNEGAPKGRTREIVSVLERTLERYPDHPGAAHFYIHAVEASQSPDRAIAAAESLANRVPGAGHLVHMPSHIWVRVGRWQDSVKANRAAVAADRAYFKHAPPPTLYTLYYAHNLHFLAYGAMMCGQYETAMQAARDLEREVPEQAVRDMAGLIEGIMPTTYHVMIRFGKWEEVLKEPKPADYRLVSRAVHHYARGIALSALGRTDEAREEIELFEQAAAEIPGEWYVFENRVDDVLPIARAMLHGELLFREGRHDVAFAHLRRAVAMEDDLVYDEPPGWMLPIRHALGALLMSAGRYAEAEAVYREDLKRNRENAWGLLGLQRALAMQNRTKEADALVTRVAAAWRTSDIEATSSCMCEPQHRWTARVRP